MLITALFQITVICIFNFEGNIKLNSWKQYAVCYLSYIHERIMSCTEREQRRGSRMGPLHWSVGCDVYIVSHV